MHLLDVFKPKRRIPIQRRKSQGSLIDGSLPDVSTRESWDAWQGDSHRALDGMFASTSQHSSTPTDSSPPPSPLADHWNFINHPRPRHRTRRAYTTGSASASSADTMSVRSTDRDTLRGHDTPHVRRRTGPASVTDSESSRMSGSTFTSSSATPSLAPTYLPMDGVSTLARESSGSQMRMSSSVPVTTGMPVRRPSMRSVHGSIHQAARNRDVHPAGAHTHTRNGSQSPTPSTMSSMSSSIVHTLDNGTKIHVPASPSPDRGRQLARLSDTEREKRRTFYIVPPGMKVIFTDDRGNEIARVGDFTRAPDHTRYLESPIILKDEQGRTIYQTGEGGQTTYPMEEEHSEERPNVIHLGNFVPENSWSVPITVTLDKRGREMVIYDSEHKSGTPAPSISSHSSSHVSHRHRPQPIRAQSAGTLYSNPTSAQSAMSFHVGSLK